MDNYSEGRKDVLNVIKTIVDNKVSFTSNVEAVVGAFNEIVAYTSAQLAEIE